MPGVINELLESVSDLPETIPKLLSDLREFDEESKALAITINDEGKELLNQMKAGSTDNDIDDLKRRLDENLLKRRELEQMVSKQQKQAKDIYDKLDGSINAFDRKNSKLRTLVSLANPRQDFGKANKRQKKAVDHTVEDIAVPPVAEVEADDPLEPTYCTCRCISYGEMVGCENEDCAIGWFHLECVGLTSLPPEDELWYCSEECRRDAESS